MKRAAGVKVGLFLSNYKAKIDLKRAAGVTSIYTSIYTSYIWAKSVLVCSKFGADKIDKD